MATEFEAIHPEKYLHDYLKQHTRPDGRDFLSSRPVSVNVNSVEQADSSATFKIGNTTVICGIKMELAEPKAETPECGYVIPNVEMSPLCSPKFRPGPPSDQAQCLTKMVDEIITNSGMLDLKNLCVCKNKLVWVVYCDLLCIDCDGSVIDTCVGALIAALMVLKLPEITHDSETNKTTVHPINKTKLPLNTIAICTTFSFFKDNILIMDPVEKEESWSQGQLSIVTNIKGFCFIHRSGGIPISPKNFSRCLAVAKKRSESLRQLIQTVVNSSNEK